MMAATKVGDEVDFEVLVMRNCPNRHGRASLKFPF